VLSVGEGAAVQVVHQCAGALVTALADAVNSANLLAGVLVNSVHSLEEILGGLPGVGVLVDVLHSVGSLEDGLVDGHAVSGHDQGILISGVVVGEAGGQSSSVDLLLVGVVEQVSDVDQLALGAPVGDQTLGSFHDQVGSGVALDGGVDLVVAVGVGQVLNGDLDAGSGLEVSHQSINSLLVAPTTDGVGPQGNLGSSSGSSFGSGLSCTLGSGSSSSCSSLCGLLGHGAGAQAHDHDHCQQNSKQFLHNVLLEFFVLFKAMESNALNCPYFSYPHQESQLPMNEIFFQSKLFSKILAIRTINVLFLLHLLARFCLF